MADRENMSVGGYLFHNAQDAGLAEAELKKIAYLEARIDYSKPESILFVYKKSIQERIFRTPVGIEYLSKLREFLLGRPEIDPEIVPDIELFGSFGGIRTNSSPARMRIRPSEKEEEKQKSRFVISVILNILLIAAVISMFTITLKSDNPNVLNYEKAVVNKYAAWEQELTEREQVIREKERELWKD